MEITIETSQVLVITRREVSRTWSSECGTEAAFVPLEEENAMLDDGANLRDMEATFGSPHFTNIAGSSHVKSVQSLLSAMTFVKRLINYLRRGSKWKIATRE